MPTQRFFLQRPNHELGHIFFCNLVGHPWCPERYAVGGIGWINPTVIAHDLLEHTLQHRVHKYTPWLEELKAFGASYYVREGTISVQSDFELAVENIVNSLIDVPSVPYTYQKLCDNNPLSLDTSYQLETYNKVYHNDIQRIADYINYGYLTRVYSNSVYNLTDFKVVENFFSGWKMPEGSTRQYFNYSPEHQEVVLTKTE